MRDHAEIQLLQENLDKIRKAMGMTNAAFYEALGVSHNTYYGWKRKKAFMSTRDYLAVLMLYRTHAERKDYDIFTILPELEGTGMANKDRDKLVERVKQLRKAGYSTVQIAKTLGIDESSVKALKEREEKKE